MVVGARWPATLIIARCGFASAWCIYIYLNIIALRK